MILNDSKDSFNLYNMYAVPSLSETHNVTELRVIYKISAE